MNQIAQNLKNSELEYSGKIVYYGIPYQTKSDIEKSEFYGNHFTIQVKPY